MKTPNNTISDRRSTESRAYTISGKIWMMVILLAILNCVLGVALFVAGSFVTSNAWLPIALSVGATAATTVAFAWWISRDVLSPLYRLNLLAKSIERTPGMSVPATTGAVETDDLLHTISRASRQLTNFVDLMDEVTAGNTKIALDPLEHSDRLSESFQKLVAKVTDSIDAKAELNALQLAVGQISNEVSGLRRGEPVRVTNTFEGTRAITDALRYLLEKRSELQRTVGPNVTELRSMVNEEKNLLAIAAEKDVARARSLKKLHSGIAQSRSELVDVSAKLAAGLGPVAELFEELRVEESPVDEKAKSQSAIKRQFDNAFHKLRDVGEQSLAITHVARTVQDLSKRSNLIALNTAVPSNGDGSTVSSAFTQEITSLSERAEKASKAIAGISDSIVRDVTEANASLHWVTTEVNKLSARASEAEKSLERAAAVLSALTELRTRIDQETAESKSTAERNLQLTEELASLCDEVTSALRSCEMGVNMLNGPLDAIRASASAQNGFPDVNAVHPGSMNGGSGNMSVSPSL